MRNFLVPILVAALSGTLITASCRAGTAPVEPLRVVIIRHGEKPESGDNLDCQGLNRALRLPSVLHAKFGLPAHIYVPTMGIGKSASHARMFETIVPFAVKYDLPINSEFEVDDYAGIAARVRSKSGTVLLVWQHESIPPLAAQFGLADPPKWKKRDFDSIWVITFPNGRASLSIDQEGLAPSPTCAY